MSTFLTLVVINFVLWLVIVGALNIGEKIVIETKREREREREAQRYRDSLIEPDAHVRTWQAHRAVERGEIWA